MISGKWLKSLRLDNRKSPEFIRSGDDLSGIPHASLIRKSFDELGLAAIHCISSVPSIAFLVQEIHDQEQIDKVHKALWNQGLVTILIVINDDELRAYSLSQLPKSDHNTSERLVKVFNLLNDALELKDLVLGVESGRLVNEYPDKFDTKFRVDQVLLTNLETTVKRLVDGGLQLESAQALLMQIMFIAYLEDKGIINAEYFYTGTGNAKIDSLVSLLRDSGVAKFNGLFKLLKEHFNGDLFVAPCSFDVNEQAEEITQEHIEVLSDFRAGNVDLNSGQMQFWPYDFKFIPIDLISAVYDRFLGFDPVKRRESGAYYTPMFLADLVAEQAWSELSAKQRANGKFVDPSCGSGIFLVRLFEKAIDEWRFHHNNQRPSWPALKAILKRIHGFDIKKESIRVASFSLYIALLENTRPAEILALMEQGRLLPKLCGQTLKAIDFFEVDEEQEKFDLIVGNPPWVSRRGEQFESEKWCKNNGFKMPAKEISWGFVWKALNHSKDDSVISFLLKATSFVTSQSSTIVEARKKWMDVVSVKQIINFADARFQLFDGGDAPTALVVYKPKTIADESYFFDYWVPKADLNLKTKRLLTLSKVDQSKLPIDLVKRDQTLMKRRMWMQGPDTKLFQYVDTFPKLSEKVITHQKSNVKSDSTKWVIGQGFNPAQESRLGQASYKTVTSDILTHLPHLDIKQYQPLVMPTIDTGPWSTNIVYRRNFEKGYLAPHILIPQGIEGKSGRLRASYCTQDLSFRTSLQAISFDYCHAEMAKFLTVLLNSSFVAWYLFHQSSVAGVERDKVPQGDILGIPFPEAYLLADVQRSENAFKRAVQFIDDLHDKKDNFFVEENLGLYKEIDEIIYAYFGLDKFDICLIEDTINYIIPSMQPSSNSKNIPNLWRDANENEWSSYAKFLSLSLTKWIKSPYTICSELVGASKDLVVLSAYMTKDGEKRVYSNERIEDFDQILSRLWKELPENFSGNFQLIPDLRVFIDDVLYIVKPRKMRFWLRSTALADADSIASDLLSRKC